MPVVAELCPAFHEVACWRYEKRIDAIDLADACDSRFGRGNVKRPAIHPGLSDQVDLYFRKFRFA
jgi:hypothetical protein